MRAADCLLMAGLVAGCGGSSKENVPKEPPPALASRCGDDFRGSGSSPERFGEEATRYDRDVEAAAAEVRRLGAKGLPALKQAAGSRDKQLVVYSGDWHGWDLLYKAPFRSKVNALVLGFLNKYSSDGE